jgi:hypothetical protein
MAELNVQPKKKGLGMWPWLLVGLIALALIVWFVTRSRGNDADTPVTVDTTATSTGGPPPR